MSRQYDFLNRINNYGWDNINKAVLIVKDDELPVPQVDNMNGDIDDIIELLEFTIKCLKGYKFIQMQGKNDVVSQAERILRGDD